MMSSLEWKEAIIQAILLAAYQALVRKDNMLYSIGGKSYPYWKVSAFAGFVSGILGGLIHNLIIPDRSKNKGAKYQKPDSAVLSLMVHSLVYVGAIVYFSSISYVQVIKPYRLVGEAVGSNLIANYISNFMVGNSSIFY